METVQTRTDGSSEWLGSIGYRDPWRDLETVWVGRSVGFSDGLDVGEEEMRNLEQLLRCGSGQMVVPIAEMGRTGTGLGMRVSRGRQSEMAGREQVASKVS